jgi:glycosyltransferase involved in cell wall biosynthesis
MSAQRRVAFVTNLAPHYRRPLFELLAERHDVDFVFFSSGEEPYLSGNLVYGAEVEEVRPRTLRVAGQAWQPGLARRLTPRRYDVVVKCLNGRLMVPWVTAIAAARNLPLVTWTGMWHHPRTPSHRLGRPLTRAVYRRSDAIAVYGSHVRDHLVRREKVDPRKVVVVGQAVPGEALERLEREDPEPPEVLFAGQLEDRKGLRDLLAAVDLLGDLDFRLVLAGSGSLKALASERAQSDERVRLLGYVRDEALGKQLARSRCLVLPSVTTRRHREPWGLVVNEAMHAGAPAVVTTAVGAAAGGLVRDGRNGLVVEERDPVALAGALRRMLLDREGAREMGERAREDVRAHSYPAMLAGFETAMELAIEARRGGSGR